MGVGIYVGFYCSAAAAFLPLYNRFHENFNGRPDKGKTVSLISKHSSLSILISLPLEKILSFF